MTADMLRAKLDRLRSGDGSFSMLAIDQRESLRDMLSRPDRPASDADLVKFKVDVTRTLSAHASAVLLDRQFGSEAAEMASCPVILAADLLHSSEAGGPVTRAELDPDVDASVVGRYRASALKMLVPWLPTTRDAAVALAARFMDLCRSCGVAGIVEGVVRPWDLGSWSPESRIRALVTAAEDFATCAPDLYKTEVPLFGDGANDVLIDASREITAALACPWVVLSSGVPAAAFPRAVALTRRGGASGFLAGRAVWGSAARAEDPAGVLEREGLDAWNRIVGRAG